MDVKERLKSLQLGVTLAKTPARKEWCQRIYNNIVRYIQESDGDDDKFKAALWKDYLAWTAWFFDGEKYPIFLTRKQYVMYLNFFKYKTNMWLYQRRAGKCKPETTIVQMLNGEHKFIKDLEIGDEIVSLNQDTGKMEPDVVSNKWMTGEKECFELHTDANYRTQATAEHKFLTNSGWKRLKDITTDDYIAVPTNLPVQPDGDLSVPESKLLSVWLAEGNKTDKHTFAFTNGNETIVDTVREAAEELNWKLSVHKTEYRYSVLRGTNQQYPRRWLDEHVPSEWSTFTLGVPSTVKRASDEAVAAFLNMYAGCDGYVDVKRGMVSFCSRSRVLCEDIRALLLRFGITSQIREHMVEWNGEVKPTYETQVYGGENFKRYAELIGVCGKEDKVDAALALIESRTYGQCKFDKIPNDTWADEVSYGELNANGADGKSDAAYALMSAKKYATTQRAKALSISEFTDHEGLRDVLMEDIAWMKVESITPIGKLPTCDIEVRNNHNFVANNMLTHNSLGTAVLTLYYMMTHPNSKTLVFAPTEDQLVLMQEARRIFSCESATELYREFLGDRVIKGSGEVDDDSLNKLGSKFNQKELRFLNGAHLTAVTLNVKGGGASRRGFSANVIIVDEMQEIESSIREEIIEPIIMDAFSDEKRLVYIGTPHTKVDRRLDVFWDNMIESKTDGTLHSHCWEAVEEGIRMPDVMQKRFRKLEIPCKWVVEHGICPVMLPDFYEKATGETIERDENGKGVVGCGDICMNNETFVQEDMAMFPRDYGLGIPPEWIKAAGKDYEIWGRHDYHKIKEDDKIIMSIDWGDVKADTQICIWKKEIADRGILKTETITLLYEEIVNDPQEVGVKNPSAEIVKNIYWDWLPGRIVVDVTGKKEQITELITGKGAIPRDVFLTNATAKKNNVVGHWSSGPIKAQMFDNMKEQLRLNKIIVPNTEMVLWDKFFSELISMKPKEATQSRPYTLWGDTMHLTDAVALAALVLQDEYYVPAAMHIAGFDIERIGSVMDDDDDDFMFFL